MCPVHSYLGNLWVWVTLYSPSVNTKLSCFSCLFSVICVHLEVRGWTLHYRADQGGSNNLGGNESTVWCTWALIDRRLQKHCFWPNSRATYLFSLGRDPYTFKDILEDLEYHPFKFDSFLCWTLAWQKLRGPFIALCLQHKQSERKVLVNAFTM